jgi:hypothetical protein
MSLRRRGALKTSMTEGKIAPRLVASGHQRALIALFGGQFRVAKAASEKFRIDGSAGRQRRHLQVCRRPHLPHSLIRWLDGKSPQLNSVSQFAMPCQGSAITNGAHVVSKWGMTRALLFLLRRIRRRAAHDRSRRSDHGSTRCPATKGGAAARPGPTTRRGHSTAAATTGAHADIGCPTTKD